jgi:hypothetical protein
MWNATIGTGELSYIVVSRQNSRYKNWRISVPIGAKLLTRGIRTTQMTKFILLNLSVKNIVSLHRNKNLTSPASNGQQRPSHPQPTMADAGGNGPLAPQMRPCAPHQRLCWIGEDPLLSKQKFIFEGWGGVSPQNTRMYCDNTSLPEQRSALRAIPPLTPHPPKIISTCWGGCRPSVWRFVRGLMPHLGRYDAISADSGPGCDGGCVCFVACLSTNHFCPVPVELWQIGYHQKALVSSKTILTLY